MGCRAGGVVTRQFSVAKEDVAQQGSPTDVRIGLRRMVTRAWLASLKTPGAARCRQSSQLGQLLGVRHKDADLGDGVGAVAAGQQPGPLRGLGGALVPD